MLSHCCSAASLEAEPQKQAFPVGDWERDNPHVETRFIASDKFVKLISFKSRI